MVNLHTKHLILENKVDNVEEKIKNKLDKEEVDQLKEEIGSIREGEKQALKEQWKKIGREFTKSPEREYCDDK